MTADSHSRSDLLDEILAAYLRAIEQGETPNRVELLARHPDLAEELREFFADHDRMNRLAQPLCDATLANPAIAAADRNRYFGDYEVLEEIARGGMGVVFKARQITLNRIVAIKMILSGHLASPADVERFHTEAEAAAKLDHPGIVPIYEVGQHEGQHYFSMGFVDGISLSAKVALGPLPDCEAAELVWTVAEAVQYAHENGVIHRDLKPGNILFDRRGNPRITDFGLAKLTEGHSHLTGTGQILGTPSYMPPEQAAGKADQVGPTADVYSLGAILYCLLTGRPPFQAATPLDTLRQVLEQDPVSARRLNAQVPLDLETIVCKCQEKDPRRRYASARSLGDELRRFLDGQPILARPVGSWERMQRSCRRNPVVASLAALVAMALMAVTVATSVAYVRELGHRREMEGKIKELDDARQLGQQRLYRSLVDQARANRLSRRIGQRFKSLELLTQAARMAREMSLPEAEFLGLRNEAIACLALADVRIDAGWNGFPSRSFACDFDATLERYARSDRDGNVCVRRVADDHLLWKLVGIGPGESLPMLSADGEYLALLTAIGYKLWNLTGLEPTVILEGPGVHAAFSPNSRQFATTERSGTVTLFDLPLGRQVSRFETGVQLGFCAWHPHRPQLAIGCSTGVKIVDLTIGAQLAHLQQADGVYFVAWHPDGKLLAAETLTVIQIWDVPSGKPTAQLKGHTDGGIKFTFSHKGDLLASRSWEDKLRLWDPRTGEQLLETPMAMTDFLRFSPDDQRLAAADPGNGQLAFINVAPADRYYRTLIRDPVHGPGSYQTPAIRRDGRLLAVGLMDGFGLWDLATGRPLEFVPGPPTYSVLFEASGALLASGNSGLARWPIDVDHPIPGNVRLGPRQQLSINGPSDRIGMSRDGRVVAHAMGWGGLVSRQSSPDSQIELRPHDGALFLDVSPDGRWVATGSHTGTKVKIWDASSGECVHDLPLEGASLVHFSPDGRWLLTTFEEYRLWAVDSWDEVRSLGASYGSAAFSPDGKVLALSLTSGVVRLVNPETGHDYARLEDPHQDRAGPMCFSPDGSQLVAIANDSHAMHVWNLRAIGQQLTDMGLEWTISLDSPTDASSQAVPLTSVVVDGAAKPAAKSAGQAQADSPRFASRRLLGHTRPVWGMAFSPEGGLLASGSDDNTIRLWDAQTRDFQQALAGHTSQVRSVCFSPDGGTLASTGFDQTVRFWNPASGASQGILHDRGLVYFPAFTKDGKILVTGSSDISPRMWNVAEQKLIRQLEGHSRTTWAVAISPEDNLIATGGQDSEIRIWNAADGSLVRTFGGHPAGVNSLAFSPTGRILAAAGGDRMVKLWNPATGELLRAIPDRQAGPTYDLAFAPNGKSLVTACHDRCVRLWDVATGDLLATFSGGGLCVAFSPDGKLLASGGADNIVSIWEMPDFAGANSTR